MSGSKSYRTWGRKDGTNPSSSYRSWERSVR